MCRLRSITLCIPPGMRPRRLLVENVRTLEDLVREMLQPMLRSWLDDNLPTLVERLVLVEIERIAGRKPPEHERRDSDIIFG